MADFDIPARIIKCLKGKAVESAFETWPDRMS